MNIKICLIFFSLISSTSIAPKLHEWCPKEQISKPRQGFLENDTIDVAIYDGRILTENSKVECTSENTTALSDKNIVSFVFLAIFCCSINLQRNVKGFYELTKY